ncbi:gustatory receptor 19 [Tribolium castaneum]|uniref:Gustatory receptor 19 n=2 Tax=Tribolium castaneum TaxID=7070 RepID=D6WJP8_TRICA|nr:PREDICTED: gustatory receptor for sugar taste 64e-like isoform X2 [Tribolium castaneum]EFA04725.1 gustatory receptor 19 [Tribolium castaneum]|eukprot:XP_015835714.1 PREDICTED: gustatory receptor for sugar taste 64e-like isoform X2 [Tribolium castaneum]
MILFPRHTEMDNTQKWSNSFKYVFFLAQCLALLPVNGKHQIYSKWKSLHILYSLFVIFVTSILLIFQIVFAVTHEFDRNVLSSIMMKIYSICALFLNIRLGSRWQKIHKQWNQVDCVMDRRYGQLKKINLRIIAILSVYFATSLGAFVNILKLQGTSNILEFELYSFVFNYVPPNYAMALIFLFVYFIYFFLSNFIDVFIASLSMAIALRFKQIRTRLELSEKSQFDLGMTEFWLEMRRDYDRLSHLCKELDDGISGLILMSFAYNLFEVISYLFHQLMMDSQQNVAFYFFFPYMVLRLLAVCLYTSWINDESLAPVNILNSVPSRNYNPEIGRWLVQMSFDNVALTGWKMFKVTRGIFLGVASIVVTYELVIMQFYGFSGKT